MGGPALMIVDNQGIFLADLFGLILSLPTALFLAFWMSAVKRRRVVVLGAFVGSFVIGFIYTFGIALFPELAYIILFLPMIFVIAFRPQGLFGRVGA